MLADNLIGKSNNEKIINTVDFQSTADLICNYATGSIFFEKDILPVLKKLSGASNKTGIDTVIKLSKCNISYEKGKIESLFLFIGILRYHDNSAQIAEMLYENSNYEESLKFAESAISLDDENLNCRD